MKLLNCNLLISLIQASSGGGSGATASDERRRLKVKGTLSRLKNNNNELHHDKMHRTLQQKGKPTDRPTSPPSNTPTLSPTHQPTDAPTKEPISIDSCVDTSVDLSDGTLKNCFLPCCENVDGTLTFPYTKHVDYIDIETSR